MSEGYSRQPRERGDEQFGQIVLQTHLGEVYSLDLYQTYESPDAVHPNFTFKGYYLPPTSDVSDRVMRRWERARLQEVPPSIPIGVELSVDAEAFDQLRDAVGIEFPSEERPPEAFRFALFDPESDEDFEFYQMYSNISLPLRYPGRTLWSGTFGGTGTRAGGEFTFVLEQYGTIEPVVWLLLPLFFVLFYRVVTVLEGLLCYSIAVFGCGDRGNVKSYHFNRSITGMTLHVDTGCEWECRDTGDQDN
jgi:hypothetical protein